ncbi:MAG: ABC transporter permease [Alphaproteobacteria bacterium GM202ARS2]|nr:ABC transporter permease [Alphaproteobacteria bacterium GM202ARS2]
MWWDAIYQAFVLLVSFDSQLFEIIGLSLFVSGYALLLSALLALPLGAVLAIGSFPLQGALRILMQSLTGLPPVLAGLLIYTLLSKQGILGILSLLYTPSAMVIVQVVIMTPLLTIMTRQTLYDRWATDQEQWLSFGGNKPGGDKPFLMACYFLYDARMALLTALLTALSRGLSEVGGVMIVGGNIEHATRVMTTAIALETSKGDLPVAFSLGFVLLLLSVLITSSTLRLQRR